MAGVPVHAVSVTNEGAIAEFVDSLLDDELSDIDGISDDEDVDPTYSPTPRNEGGPDDADSSGEDDESQPTPTPLPVVRRRPVPGARWNPADVFDPLPPAPPPEPGDEIPRQSPIDAFHRYLPARLFDEIAMATSQKILASTGKEVNVSPREIRQFFGMNIVMSYLKYPRIRMYWSQKTRIDKVADVMPRNKFFLIRANLCVRDYTTVSQDEKASNKFWKIAPLLNSVRNACLDNPRSDNVSIDEQMIPFHGRTSARQFVKNKPNPVGLKNFVSTAPDGLPLDFFIYQGKGDTIIDVDPNLKMDIGGKAVLKLSQTLPEGCSIFMDRYFTSEGVLNQLFAQGLQGTGTLQKNRIPQDCPLESDANLRREGRGSYMKMVRDDGQVCVLKWMDNKPVVVISNVLGGKPVDEVKRWCKSTKEYIYISRPTLIAQYNKQMGGVDFLDRMISYYRTSARTKKWTVRTIFHFIDFALAATWFERRRSDLLEGTPKRDQFGLLEMKVDVADSILQWVPNEAAIVDATGNQNEQPNSEQPQIKRSKTTPLPDDHLRQAGALHLPEIPAGSKPSRCRFPGCDSPKCRFRCTVCQVFLCLNNNRNCFKAFHEL